MWCMLREGSLMRGRWSEWQCAGIFCQQRMKRKKKNISTYIARRKEKENKKNRRGNWSRTERAPARHLDPRLTR